VLRSIVGGGGRITGYRRNSSFFLSPEKKEVAITEDKYQIRNNGAPPQRIPRAGDLSREGDDQAKYRVADQPECNHSAAVAVGKKTRTPSDICNQDKRGPEQAGHVYCDWIERQCRQEADKALRDYDQTYCVDACQDRVETKEIGEVRKLRSHEGTDRDGTYGSSAKILSDAPRPS